MLQFLRLCKPGVSIINVARGGLLDYDAIKSGLDEGNIGGLGLDVQWHEPFDPDDFMANHPRCSFMVPPLRSVSESHVHSAHHKADCLQGSVDPARSWRHGIVLQIYGEGHSRSSAKV